MATDLNPAVLDGIGYDTRWTIANALRTAVDKYKANAEELRVTPGHARLAEQFDLQAREAAELADHFENC